MKTAAKKAFKDANVEGDQRKFARGPSARNGISVRIPRVETLGFARPGRQPGLGGRRMGLECLLGKFAGLLPKRCRRAVLTNRALPPHSKFALGWSAAFAFFAGALLACSGTVQADEPVKVIFDTDISGDVDDVLALAMLHTLEDRGACELLGVTISKINPLTGPFTDAINTFYGRPDLPIGVTRDAQVRESRYLALVNEKDGDAFRYPHDLLNNEDTPDAVSLLRQLLAAQPDGSVSIIQVGLATNVAGLLHTEADEFSPLSGVELVRKKVRLLSVMAGAFTNINGSNHYLEANVINGIPVMQDLAAHWPDEVPVIWSGFEIGIAVAYPRESIANDFSYVPHHPVKEAYLLHSGPEHDRPTWDLTSVLYAVYPERGYFDLSVPGRVSVEGDGFTRFTPVKKGAQTSKRDRFLLMSPTQAARVQEALVQLVCQPPQTLSQKP